MRLVQIIEDLGRKLRIGYDLDDVLADLDQILRQEVSKVANRYIPKDARTSYYFEDIPELLDRLGMTKDQLGPLVVKCFGTVFGARKHQIAPLTGAIQTIRELQKDGHTIVIITARDRKRSSEITNEWLKHMGLSGIPVYFAGTGPIRSKPKNSKAKLARLLKLDYFIDDSVENIGQFKKTGQHHATTPIVMDQPWNQQYKGPRLKSHDQTLELLNKIDDSPRKQPHRWFEHKLNSALHAISEEAKSLADILPNNKIIQKLLRWSYNNHNHTRSRDIHTSKVIANELRNGQRLVGNPDKQDVDAVDFEDFYVVDYGNQLLVSLPENADIIKLLLSYTTSDPTAHIVRGLAFGYKPSEVVWYYNIKQRDHNWVEYLHQHGLALSMDYTADGYASTVDNKKNVAYAIIEPGDIHQIQNIKLPIITIARWCPECGEYISELETDTDRFDGAIPPDTCPHTPQHTPDKPSGQRHGYIISYDISNVESLQPISEGAKFDPSRRDFLRKSMAWSMSVSPIGKLALSFGGVSATAVKIASQLPESTAIIVADVIETAASWDVETALSEFSGSLDDETIYYNKTIEDMEYDEQGEPTGFLDNPTVEQIPIPTKAFAGALINSAENYTTLVYTAANEGLLKIGGNSLQQFLQRFFSDKQAVKAAFNECAADYLAKQLQNHFAYTVWYALNNVGMPIPQSFQNDDWDIAPFISWLMRSDLLDLNIGRQLLTNHFKKTKQPQKPEQPKAKQSDDWSTEYHGSMHQLYDSFQRRLNTALGIILAETENSTEPKQPPIVRYRQQAAHIQSQLPPVQPDHIRLWRGNRPTDDIGHATRFTDDLPGIAIPFAKFYDGKITYIDIPQAELRRYENKGASAPGSEFNIPIELARQAREISL